MQHVLETNKKRRVQGCKNAVAPRDRKRSARPFFTIYISCIWMLYGKACMCVLRKIAARY